MSSALVVIIDGCNENYINAASMPFVYHLKQEGSYIKMASIPSFDLRLALFTGLTPHTTDTFVAFCLRPQVSAFRWLQWLKPSLTWHTGRPQIGWLLSVLHYLRSGVRSKFTGISLVTAAHYALTKTWVDFGCIPLALLPYFSVDESIGLYQRKERMGSHGHLFGILRAHGFDVHFIYDDTEAITHRAVRVPRRAGQRGVWILHYGDSDKAGHRFGPNSEQMRSVLRDIDASIRSVFAALEHEIDFLLLLSDHGMVEVQVDIDLWQALQELEAEIARDYFVFLNSPLARFWFKTCQAETEVRQLLDRFRAYGREVTKDELAAKQIPTDDRYGELIFWVRPGVNIWPNFYHQTPVRGMHTYFDHEDMVPLLLCHRQAGLALAEPAHLKDVTPTILDLLGIPIPSMDGKSVLVGA